MTTGYTRAELKALKSAMLQHAPRLATSADLNRTPRIAAVTMAASEGAMVFIFKVQKGDLIQVHMNVVVVAELFIGINAAGENGGWWTSKLAYQRAPSMRIPTSEDAETSADVISLTTSAAGKDMLVNLAGELSRETFMIKLSREVAGEIFVGIEMAAEKFGWWDDTMALIPNDGTKLQ